MVITAGLFSHRRDVATAWANSTDALLAGEVGIDVTNKQFRWGDGVTLWPSLPSPNTGPDSIYDYGDAVNDPVNVSGSIFVYIHKEWRPGPTLPVVGGVVQYSLDVFDDVTYPGLLQHADSLVWNSLSNFWEATMPVFTALVSTTAPSTPTDAGESGEIRYDASYIYVCVDTDTWKRAPLTTW